MSGRADDGIHMIVLVDVMPDHQAQGASVLTDFVREARGDGSVRSITLIQQVSAPNHYAIDAVFADQSAHRRFIQAPHIRSIREALYQHLGSPWDGCLGADVPV